MNFFFFLLQLISVKTVPLGVLLLTIFQWEDMDLPWKNVTRTLSMVCVFLSVFFVGIQITVLVMPTIPPASVQFLGEASGRLWLPFMMPTFKVQGVTSHYSNFSKNFTMDQLSIPFTTSSIGLFFQFILSPRV